MEITKTMVKNFNNLALMIECKQLSYDYLNKMEFKKLGKNCFRTLAKLLGLDEFNVHYNESGIACSGDLSLMGMWEDKELGIYITMNDHKVNGSHIMFRTIKHMKDYTGGSNNWARADEMLNLPHFIEKLKRVS